MLGDPQAEVEVVLVIFPVQPVELALKSQVVGVICPHPSPKKVNSTAITNTKDLDNCFLFGTSLNETLLENTRSKKPEIANEKKLMSNPKPLVVDFPDLKRLVDFESALKDRLEEIVLLRTNSSLFNNLLNIHKKLSK